MVEVDADHFAVSNLCIGCRLCTELSREEISVIVEMILCGGKTELIDTDGFAFLQVIFPLDKNVCISLSDIVTVHRSSWSQRAQSFRKYKRL